MTLTGAGGTGPGAINDTGYYGALYLSSTETITNTEINLGNSKTSHGGSAIRISGGGVVTLATTDTITHAGAYAELGGAGTMVNAGTIVAGLKGGRFVIDPTAFVNAGSISVSNGDYLYVRSGTTFTNSGAITVSGGRVGVESTFTNTGAITVGAGGYLGLEGGSSTNTASISGSSGAALYFKALSNAGGTLNVGAGVNLNGTIAGGKIQGLIDLSANYSHLSLTNGVTLTGAGGTGPGAINDTGYYGALYLSSTETITNTGINLGNSKTSHGGSAIRISGGGVVTLATTDTITHAGAYAELGGAGTMVNAGTIVAGLKGGRFVIDPTAFVNAGSISVSNGDYLYVRSGTTFTNSGAITVSGGGMAYIASTKFTNLVGSVLTGGQMEVDAGSTLQLNGKVATDAATIILSGSNSVFDGGNVTLDSTLATISSVGVLEILSGRGWSSKLAMINAGSLQLGGGVFAPAKLNNTGVVSGFGTVATSLTNSGTVSTQTGKTISLVGGTLTNLSGTTLTGGTFVVGAGATLQLANNSSIATLAATIDLIGAGSVLQGLNTGNSTEVTLESSLTAIAASGVLGVLAGRNYSATGAIANAGVIQVGGGTFSSGALTDAAGSTLSGFGTVASTFSDAGVVTAVGGALAFSGTGNVFAAALAGTEIDFSGGTDALNSGSSLTAAAVGLSGGAVVTVGAAQTFSGTLNEAAASTLSIASGNAFTASGTSSFAGTVSGAGTLTFAGGNATVGAGAIFTVARLTLRSAASLSLTTNLGYAGSLILGPATLALNANTLTLSGGTSSLAGTVSGTGTLAFTGGTQAINAGTVLSVSSWTISGAASATLNTTLNYAGALTEAAGVTFAISTGDTLTLTGAGSSLAGTVSGAGMLVFSGGSQALNAGAALSISALSVGAGAAVSVNENLTYGGAFSEDATSSLTVAAGDTLSLTGAVTMAGAVNGAGALFLTNGSASVNAGATFGVASLYIQSGASVTLNENLGYAGTLATAAGTTLALGANTLTLTGSGTTLQGAISGTGSLIFAGGDQTFYGPAPLSIANWSLSNGDATTIDAALSYGGTFSEDATSSIVVGGGETFTLSGVATLAGAIGGAGTLVFSGGTETLNAGATITTAGWSIGGGAVVNINGALTYAGALTEDATSSIVIGAGDSLTLDSSETLSGTLTGNGTLSIASGDTLILSGPSSFGGAAVVNGAGALSLANATISALTIGGTLALTDTGTVTQTGAVTLGDAGGAAASLTVAAGATWTLGGDVGVALGKSKTSALTILGTLIKSAGSGTSKISPKITDNGLVEAASGTLDLAGNVAGRGALKIDAGATLELAKTVAKTLTVSFDGAGATLDVGKPARMAATIAGFTSGQTIDLLKTAATGASVNGSDQLVVVNGSKTVATLQLSGNYAGQTFTVGSDGKGGSTITLSGPDAPRGSPALFVQTMAGVGAGGGAVAAHATPSSEAVAPTRLAAPGAQP